MAHGALTPIIGLRLLALAAGLRHNAEIGQPGLCFRSYGHKFRIKHLGAREGGATFPGALLSSSRIRTNRSHSSRTCVLLSSMNVGIVYLTQGSPSLRLPFSGFLIRFLGF